MEDFIHDIEDIIELVGIAFDVFGVAIIVVGTLLATARFFNQRAKATPDMMSAASPYRRYKIDIGLALLLGLEVLVAADIIKTIAIEPSFTNVGVLGLLVVIRTFLSWTLLLEVEGRFPWQPERGEA